jgi:hypothetical protein
MKDLMKPGTRALLTYHDLTVEVDELPGQELIDHMMSTVLGQPGSFQYQHMHLEEKLSAPGENYYLYLKKQGKMLGSVGFIGRHTTTSGFAHDSWMIRFFSIKAPMGTVPRERKQKAAGEDSRRRSVLGRFILPVMANPSVLREEASGDPPPAIVYALIEKNNLRSMNFSTQMGLETVGEVTTFSFTRLQPGISGRVERLEDAKDLEVMKTRLHDYYGDHTLFFSGPLFKYPGYFVIREGSEILAGIQAYQVSWKVIDFGSRLANGFIRLITLVPWIRKRLDPKEVRLLALDAIYCSPGKEPVLYELMEGVLAETGNYMAIMMLDSSSRVHDIFQKRGKMGFVSRFIGTFTADVRIRFIEMPERVKEHFKTHPTYIPTYDNS